MNTEEKFLEKTQKMYEIFSKKNKDYGDHFVNYSTEGAYMDLLRKWRRIETVFKNGETNVDDETLKDTLIDLANYCILTSILIEKKENEK